MSLDARLSALGRECADDAAQAFERYNAEFRAVTRRAPGRFDARDWHGSQRDAVERIELYAQHVDSEVAGLRLKLGEDALNRELWIRIREEFASGIAAMPDAEFRKTFFNSLTRRLFGTVGVAPEIEFVALDLDPLAGVSAPVETESYANRGSLELLFEELLASVPHKAPWRDFDRSVRQVARAVQGHAERVTERRSVQSVELIRPVFYQISRAYLVGRIVGRDWTMPLVIALKNSESGILVDAVFMTEDDVSILFGFARSYFHVDLERVAEAALFLKNLMPRKPVSEIFTMLGRAKQGKTERYREFVRHLAESDDQFIHAAGERGLVMVVFMLPSYDVVFKLIRDRFPAVKTASRSDVLNKYDFVFKHDRAGRLVDAQEFRRLRLPKARFSEALLAEFKAETAGTVHEDGDDLIIDHCYVERRMTPLNLYLRDASPEDSEKAVIEYGQAIRDLANTNIFAGDLLLKNFGVTRHGRVIFYDYDELCLVTECRFREMPAASSDEDEMRAESWFYVADNDVFPETFINFLGMFGPIRDAFLAHHGEILTAQWWRGVQARLAADEVLEVLPYPHAHRIGVASSL